ncbi:helix-turn-helix domain-containing protein [Pseudoroseomonas wenyumeiae]|uniref:Helix-turn-helix domain-containing protein n=1 Tax=Teichococcus wenyumeiae TaxID=2478470 RepID=A0A3A9J412_9PROT|nr:helix-turn-helix domain-containing protein [Pseudoroseomonas wenyumeiae]RKK01192.1 helix-turn-helix domain-containing protein [Pseudoroseomonas wenyumeiae]RMI14516.1 helix-turn-helix domain-containing protein [Pseudoroseomonas wenyumeiae]
MHTISKADSAVGYEIRRHRRQAGLTQKDVAARIGVTGAQFHRYETGATRITMSRLIAIAAALNMRPDTLLAAASTAEAELRLAPSNVSQEIIDLVQMFASIEPQHRSALVAVARMISSSPQQHPRPEAVVGGQQGAADMLQASDMKIAA